MRVPHNRTLTHLRAVAAIALAFHAGCVERSSTPIAPAAPPENKSATTSRAELVAIIAPLIDPAKLDTLRGERAATPRLRKVCYWLETARRSGFDASALLVAAHASNGFEGDERELVQREALLRNVTILERLGCFDTDGMDKLRRGNAPTITLGPYAGQLATADHILPRSVVPELDNRLYNLEFMPDTLNASKGAKLGARQRSLARQWHVAGLLSDEGLRATKMP